MPVPKGKERAYGAIVGKHINDGKDPAEAKDLADRALKHLDKKQARKMSRKYPGRT